MTNKKFIEKLYEFVDSNKELFMGRNRNGHETMKYDFVSVFHNWLETGENAWDDFEKVDDMCRLVKSTIENNENINEYNFEYIKNIIPTFELLKEGKFFFSYKNMINRHTITEKEVKQFLNIVEEYIRLNPKGNKRRSSIKIIRR